jgi:hypothetical protein
MRGIAVVTLSLAAFAACSTVRVTTDYDPEVDFATVDTYAWLDQRSGVEGDRADVTSLLDQRIRHAIDDVLQGKGLALVPRDEARVLVSYHLGVETKLDVNTIHTGYGYGRGWYGAGGSTHTTVREYEEGTLLIDLVDALSRQLVWRGSGEARVRRSTSPEQREERIRKAVAEILADFPPDAA